MKIRINYILSFALCAVALCVTAECSMTKHLEEDESLLVKNKLEIENNDEYKISSSDLQKYIKQSPKSGIFGWQPRVSLYNFGNGSGKGWDKFVKKLGTPPLIFDEGLVGSSNANIIKHLTHIGFYGSTVKNDILIRNKKAFVTYNVTPGSRYIIDSISYSIENEPLRELFFSHADRNFVKEGSVLSENALDTKADVMAKIFRNSGYYGFNKNYFFFTADTLSHDGHANLNVEIKDYTRNETEQEARKHRVYSFGDVVVNAVRTYPNIDKLAKFEADSVFIAKRDSVLQIWQAQTDTARFKNIFMIEHKNIKPLVRKRVLNRLNLITPGERFDERVIEGTYARFSSLGLFSTVNVMLEEKDSTVVDSRINLQATTLQGYKINLQGSTNSSGLFGISPALSYYHKNLFRGAEVLTVSFMGDFQFKPKSDARSTELGVSASIELPKFLFAPDKWFRTKTLPHTEFTLSYNYQKRPEYERNILSGSFNYTWNWRQKWFFKVAPIQANIVKLNNLDTAFYRKLSDPFLRNSYRNHFDIGSGFTVSYTTNAASKPTGNYFYTRYSLDLSGNLISLFNSTLKKDDNGDRLLWGSPYSQYYKMEWQGVYTMFLGDNPNHSMAFRLLGGVGRGYGNSAMVPFEKLFWGGGAYDMRGWQPRTLGPGYAPRDTAFRIANQTGDIKLEANMEYRFPLFSIFNGAIFAEAGNVWTFKRTPDPASGDAYDRRGVFDKDFYNSLAVDWGVGLRLDITFLILRLDWGFKTYDPAPQRWNGPNRWFKSGNNQLTFGIGLPF